MALSLEAIYRPMNDFFLDRFKTADGSSVLFRFDKFGSVLDEEDFKLPNPPDDGYSSALAVERVSDLVNHIPVDQEDGLNVVFSQDAIDTTYGLRILEPSLPAFPEGAGEATKQALMDAFNAIKAEARKRYDSVTLESITGLMLQYKPCTASPEDWYDVAKSTSWTQHSFEASQPATPATPPTHVPMWRLKLGDEALRQIIDLKPVLRTAVSPVASGEAPIMARASGGATVANDPIRLVRPIRVSAASSARPTTSFAAVRTGATGAAGSTAVASPRAVLHDEVRQKVRAMTLSDRIHLRQVIGPQAPTQPAETNRVTISFEYCLVTVDRKWYLSSFINDLNWYVPTLAKGQLTAPGTAGSLALVPIAFVAIRKLAIAAHWTEADIQTATKATGFGPFKVSADIVNMKLSHPGMQIIGWILQKLPALPPKDEPLHV